MLGKAPNGTSSLSSPALRTLCAAALAHVGCSLMAQTDTTANRYTLMIGARADVGKVFQTNDFLKDYDFSRYGATHVEFGWQTRGTRDWEIAHNLPSFGVGFGTAWFDKDATGQPLSLFGFYNGVISRHGAHSVHYNIDAGLAWNWDCYDERHNPDNIAIGSKLTCRIGLGLKYAYTIAERWRIGIGGGFTHYSNGAVRKPNKGINVASAQVSLQYLLQPTKLPPQPKLEKLKGNEIDITVGYGTKMHEVSLYYHPEVDNEFKPGARYNSVTLQCQFLHQYCHKGKYGGGISGLYDELSGSDIRAVGDDVEVILGPAEKRFYLGLFAAHEFCISRMAIVSQSGCYLRRPSNLTRRQRKEFLFQRLGLKYTLPMNLHMGVNIYAHRLAVADFIEWNIGYSIKMANRKNKVCK